MFIVVQPADLLGIKIRVLGAPMTQPVETNLSKLLEAMVVVMFCLSADEPTVGLLNPLRVIVKRFEGSIAMLSKNDFFFHR